MAKRVLISGYYGFDNVGDEAVLYAMLHDLRRTLPADTQLVVLSAQPEKTAARYGVAAIDRWSKKAVWQAVKDCDLLISGGGSLLQDVTSKNGILYYLGIIWLAAFYHKPVMIYSQGIGPIHGKRNRRLTARLLNRAEAITVRDFESRTALTQMGVDKEILVAVDPVLGVSGVRVDGAAGQRLLAQQGWQPDKQTLMLSIRPWGKSESYLRELAACGDHFANRGWQVVLVPMQQSQDHQVCQEVAALMHQPSILLSGPFTPEEALAVFKNAQLIVGMRLHALIMGVALRVPVVGVAYDPKVTAFMASLKLPQCLPVEGLDGVEIIRLLEETWRERDSYIEKLMWRMEIINEQAAMPASIVQELLSR